MSMILMVLASGLVPLTDPGGWISSDDYPAEARRSSETGTATVSLTVDDGGRPTACNVVASTSSETLDAATCTLLMERARFRRPSDPEQNTTQLRVKWALTPPDLMPVAQGGVIADLAFDAEGDVLDCNERILGSARMFPGNACDFGPQALDKIFGSA